MERAAEGRSSGDSGRMGHRSDPLSMIPGSCLCLHLVGARCGGTVWAQAKHPLPHKGPDAVQVSLNAGNVCFSILQAVCSSGFYPSPLGSCWLGYPLSKPQIPCVVALNVLPSVHGYLLFLSWETWSLENIKRVMGIAVGKLDRVFCFELCPCFTNQCQVCCLAFQVRAGAHPSQQTSYELRLYYQCRFWLWNLHAGATFSVSE